MIEILLGICLIFVAFVTVISVQIFKNSIFGERINLKNPEYAGKLSVFCVFFLASLGLGYGISEYWEIEDKNFIKIYLTFFVLGFTVNKK